MIDDRRKARWTFTGEQLASFLQEYAGVSALDATGKEKLFELLDVLAGNGEVTKETT